MMEMHELQQAWNGLDERLARQTAMLQQIQRRRGIDAARARLRLMSLALIIQLAIGVLIVLWAGSYWVGHLGQTHLLIYGLSIHLYGIGLLGAAIMQLTHIAQLDYRAAVLDVQRKLVALRRLRIASERVLMICGFVVWVPMLFVALRAIGVDVWITRPAAVLGNLAVGLGLGVLVAWLTHRFRGWFERDAAGRSLREAEAELAELARSEGGD
jgi:hypothetical protein